MARVERRDSIDPHIVRLRREVDRWRSQLAQLRAPSTQYSEWVRVQFEARRAFLLAQREYIDLHVKFLGRVRQDHAAGVTADRLQEVHRLIREFSSLLDDLQRAM